MLDPQQFHSILTERGLSNFYGVPDSCLKDLCGVITDKGGKGDHIIAANEGNAIAMAAGYYLATNKPAVVYLQNSGQGNTINPINSLSKMFEIPMLLIVGWRGEPNLEKADAPQHIHQGETTKPIFDAVNIPHSVLPTSIQDAQALIGKALEHIKSTQTPYAILVRKGSFEKYSLQKVKTTNFELNREGAIETVVSLLSEKAIVVGTTGKTSRELYELRKKQNTGTHKDFYMAGSMGHASSIALALAQQQQNKRVWCFDGDGAFIMHMGAAAIIGQEEPKNFYHIVFNNFAHDSVGGQPTASDTVNIQKVALACGYKTVFRASTKEEIQRRVKDMQNLEGPVLLEIYVNKGARKDLGRPKEDPVFLRNQFMEHLSRS